ncbi:MAG: hypothetical protein HYS08_08840 [Chlamydiae bacterium]|nr:hypothetical protein [Chlamydiota bacterium]MBI3265469.1 hypothetical protein [Chlamydiota bacterium]
MKGEIQRQGEKKKVNAWVIHPVKLTALMYLKEALLKERYEECHTLIQTAVEFGASPWEIRNLLEEPRRPVG